MVFKKILYPFIFFGFLSPLISCQENNDPANSIIIWVNSFELRCDPPNLDVNCLFVSEEEDLDDAVWDIQVPKIIGFDQRDDFIYQLLVQKLPSEIDPGNSTSEIKYQLIKVLKKEFNTAINLSGQWHLEYIEGYTNQDEYIYTGKFYGFDSFTRFMYGTYKCNTIKFKAKGITKDKVTFSQATIVSENECSPINDNYLTGLEERIFFNFLQVKNYRVKDGYLHLMDEEGKPLLIFQKRYFYPKY